MINKNVVESMENTKTKRLTDISETLLFPLYCRAIESKSKNPILEDPKAVEIVNQLNIDFLNSNLKLHKMLLEGKLSKKIPVIIALRSKKFDEHVQNFCLKKPDCTIVNIGCGLDTRFTRIDDGKIEWYDLDLPEVIKIRKRFFNESDRYHFISSSVLNFEWMEKLAEKNNRSFLFIAEGVFMYLPEDKIKQLVLKLQANFPECELACQLANIHVVQKLKKEYWKKRFQKQFCLGENVTFLWGVRNGSYLERWNQRIELLDEWTYLDESIKKIGVIRFFSRFKSFRKAPLVAYYLLK